MTGQGIPAGWYVDPSGEDELRYWDGSNWLDSTMKRPTGWAAGSRMHRQATTLASVPGLRIVEAHGLASTIGSNAGWTATTKGEIAMTIAYRQLIEAAERLGANDVSGVVPSAFGACAGITVAGGDAVGIALVGTAVTIEPREE